MSYMQMIESLSVTYIYFYFLFKVTDKFLRILFKLMNSKIIQSKVYTNTRKCLTRYETFENTDLGVQVVVIANEKPNSRKTKSKYSFTNLTSIVSS